METGASPFVFLHAGSVPSGPFPQIDLGAGIVYPLFSEVDIVATLGFSDGYGVGETVSSLGVRYAF